MKKSERIFELVMELEKELASLPAVQKKLGEELSEYDSANNEMYHMLLNFNPSASESAKFVKNWQKALRERHEIKYEMARLSQMDAHAQTLLQHVRQTKSFLINRKEVRNGTFVYKTNIGQEIIEDSFSNFEKRTTHPFKFEGEKVSEPLAPTAPKPKATLELARELKAVPFVPEASESLILDSNDGKFYLIHSKGIVTSASSWTELVEYLNEKVHLCIQIEKQTRHKLESRMSHTLKTSTLTPQAKKAIQNMMKNNSPKPSDERLKRMALYEEVTAVKLGKYQLPGQRDQQKKSS